ncbi:hypothetical protein CIW61_04295 [Enterobacter cloacae]|nr:hypothetical protein CIW61_04295 [Enterobacter cloacae]
MNCAIYRKVDTFLNKIKLYWLKIFRKQDLNLLFLFKKKRRKFFLSKQKDIQKVISFSLM